MHFENHDDWEKKYIQQSLEEATNLYERSISCSYGEETRQSVSNSMAQSQKILYNFNKQDSEQTLAKPLMFLATSFDSHSRSKSRVTLDNSNSWAYLLHFPCCLSTKPAAGSAGRGRCLLSFLARWINGHYRLGKKRRGCHHCNSGWAKKESAVKGFLIPLESFGREGVLR